MCLDHVFTLTTNCVIFRQGMQESNQDCDKNIVVEQGQS